MENTATVKITDSVLAMKTWEKEHINGNHPDDEFDMTADDLCTFYDYLNDAGCTNADKILGAVRAAFAYGYIQGRESAK